VEGGLHLLLEKVRYDYGEGEGGGKLMVVRERDEGVQKRGREVSSSLSYFGIAFPPGKRLEKTKKGEDFRFSANFLSSSKRRRKKVGVGEVKLPIVRKKASIEEKYRRPFMQASSRKRKRGSGSWCKSSKGAVVIV